MAMHVEEDGEESTPGTGFLRQVITACGRSAWRASTTSPYLLAAEAGRPVGGEGGLEMATLPGYQRLPSTCERTFPDDDGGEYGAQPSSCPPRAARMLLRMLTRAVLRWCGGDEEASPAPAAGVRKERWQSSWRPDPDRRWPAQGWC